MQNLAPGAVERMGLGWEQLARENPSLITLDISGYAGRRGRDERLSATHQPALTRSPHRYGDEGPMSDYKAYDLLVCAEAGLCSITGTPDGPGRAGIR